MMETRKEHSMKSILAASPALVIAGALLAAPASAQTVSQPMMNQPMAQPYAGQAMPQPQAAQATLPQGPYLGTCKDARMLEDTLTAFCSKGDGSWQTTQLWHADSCTGGVQNAGGDLVCGMEPQVGSSTPPESYGSAAGTLTPPAVGTYSPAYTPAPTYPPPAYNGYGSATTSWPNAYGTSAYGANGYGPYSAPAPSEDQYYSPSASKTARPYGY
jgi:hypothetical protein